MKRLTGIILCACFSISFFTEARPTVGLVLSGGGAKGTAHVGVLKVLEFHHIPVDYIAGTSIGAFVGGMYALGYSADEIEAIMLHTDWSKGYSDIIPREDLSYRDKQERDKYNIPLNIGFSDGKIKMPSGVLRGQTMSKLLRNSTNLVHEYTSFNDLPIPFRAVATNLATSKAVILDSGSIVQAMQASATVPGVLSPDDIDSKLLVDGGIANNMPVNVAKAMGADIIIAVDIGSSLKNKTELDSTVAVLTQLSTFLTNASTEKQIKMLTSKDILLRPDVGDMSTTDFNIMPEVLPLGVAAAMAKIDKLNTLAVSDADYQLYLNKKRQKRQQWQADVAIPTSQIVLNNRSKVSNSLIRETLGLKVGTVITKTELEQAVENVYALNKFERVKTEFIDMPNERILSLTTEAKSWGPNYFQLGLNWEDDFKFDSSVTFDLAYTMTDLTANGGEWRNEMTIGSNKMFATEFYQPLVLEQFFYSKFRYQYEISSLHQYLKNSRFLTFNENKHRADMGVGYNYVKDGRAELGITGEKGQLENKIIFDGNVDYSSYGGYFKFGYDSLNSISFPTQGNRFSFNVYLRDEDFNWPVKLFADQNEIVTIEPSKHTSLQFEADWKGALSVGNHAIVGKVSLATVDKEGEFSLYQSYLGGFLNLSGYTKNALIGPHKLFGALIYQYDLGHDALGLTDFPLYLGSSVEAGNVWRLRDDIDLHNLIYSGSLYLGTDTRLGPAAIGFGLSNKGEQAVYLFLGKNF